jgi:hypothetical protein
MIWFMIEAYEGVLVSSCMEVLVGNSTIVNDIA